MHAVHAENGALVVPVIPEYQVFCTQRNFRSVDPVLDQTSFSQSGSPSVGNEFKLSVFLGGYYRLSLNGVRTELDS